MDDQNQDPEPVMIFGFIPQAQAKEWLKSMFRHGLSGLSGVLILKGFGDAATVNGWLTTTSDFAASAILYFLPVWWSYARTHWLKTETVEATLQVVATQIDEGKGIAATVTPTPVQMAETIKAVGVQMAVNKTQGDQ
jgi:hypothetical protein